MFLWWCGDVFVVVFLCFCGGAVVFCGGVVMFLRLCFVFFPKAAAKGFLKKALPLKTVIENCPKFC